VGLIARALELTGVATTLTSWNAGRTRVTAPPRATFTQLNRGSAIGAPHDIDQQLRILTATLDLLEQPAPVKPVRLNETMGSF
jgi:hypothetical protein